MNDVKNTLLNADYSNVFILPTETLLVIEKISIENNLTIPDVISRSVDCFDNYLDNKDV